MTAATMRFASKVVRDVRSRRALTVRRPPAFSVGPDNGRPARVFYLTPDDNGPSGGVRNLYRHVDVLGSVGVEAFVLHSRRGFRCTWFANETPVVAAQDITFTPADLLVIPEWYGPWLHTVPAGLRKVIFNQGPYLTFDLISFDETSAGAPYSDIDGIEGVLTVSDDAEALLRYTFPGLPVSRARVVVDGRLFHTGEERRERRIGFLARGRRAEEREMLLHMLRARGVLDRWELVPIQGTETETAQLMRTCPIFLAFGFREGFGLPPAEAMASGCYVVGFTALGGKEYFDPAYCSPVPECDLTAFGRAIEVAMERYDSDPEDLAKAGRVAAAHILDRYSMDLLRNDLVAFYEPLLARSVPMSR